MAHELSVEERLTLSKKTKGELTPEEFLKLNAHNDHVHISNAIAACEWVRNEHLDVSTKNAIRSHGLIKGKDY